MTRQYRQPAHPHEFKEVVLDRPTNGEHLTFYDLKSVTLPVTADLGQTMMSVRDILELGVGSVVQLNKIAGEMTDIYAGGLSLAKGEVVVIADSIHVRISEILGAMEEKDNTAEAFGEEE